MFQQKQSIDYPLQQWREGFRRYNLLPEIEEDDEGLSFLAAELASHPRGILNPLHDGILPFQMPIFDDYSSEYIEYLGNRFTYY